MTLWIISEDYINKVLERYNVQNCSIGVVPLFKGEKFNFN